MKDYLDMTMWELEQERQKIIKEVERRLVLVRRARELGLPGCEDALDPRENAT